jgi:hypothetical protein
MKSTGLQWKDDAMRYLMILGLGVVAAACNGQRAAAPPTAPSTSAITTATQTQNGRGAAPVEVTFTKWITTYPALAGVTGGDVAGTFVGEVLSFTPFDNGVIADVRARYEVRAGAHSFTAEIEGKQNNETATAVLNGVVTEGWLAGARVHVEFDVISTCTGKPEGPCFRGTIRVMPGSAD